MNFGHTKTKLDYIIENGLRRIDEAVERVIAKHTSFQDVIDSAANQVLENGKFMADNIGNIYDTERRVLRQSSSYDSHQLISIEDIPLPEHMREAAMAQRQYNAAQTQMVNLFDIGNQSAAGSPLSNLGAAYRQSRGML